ncbi:MAG: hypothetical protein ACOYOA_09900 [Saprospiraceae bacterium]
MKNSIINLVTFLFCASLFAQAPQLMSYQAVIRNSNNLLVANAPISMRISILQGSAFGAPVYVESHSASTNGNGLAMISIGSGTAQNGIFSAINWANGPYFVKSETDPGGGSNYSIVSTSQLMSVPYALFAEKSANPGPQGPAGPKGDKGDTGSPGAGMQNGTATGQMMYWNGTAWVTIAPGENNQTLSFCNGVPTWGLCQVYCSGSPTPVVNVTNPTTGKIWMDRNLGASQAASSSTDAAGFGDLYQWGRRADGHQCRNSGTTSVLNSTDQPGHDSFILVPNSPFDWRSSQNANLWQGVNGINNPCPSTYRLPSNSELDAERLSWNGNSAAGAFASPLKLTMASGRYHSIGSLYDVGSSGNYWSSTVSGIFSQILQFYSSSAASNNVNRAYGFSVRCIKD